MSVNTWATCTHTGSQITTVPGGDFIDEIGIEAGADTAGAYVSLGFVKVGEDEWGHKVNFGEDYEALLPADEARKLAAVIVEAADRADAIARM